MDLNLDSIKKKIEIVKPELVNQFHLSQISIFGSYVRGEEKPESDIDILVSFSILPSLFEFIDLQIYLSDLLGKKVDLVILEDLKPRISETILREKINIL
jgi:predicted nucleotidyltransferase